MTPVGAVALGLLVALLDLRVAGFDVLPDVVGWLVVTAGLGRLVHLDPHFRTARTWAATTAVLALGDLVRPQVTTTTGTTTTTADAAPAGLQGVLVTACGAAGVVAVVLLCLALRDRAREAGDVPAAERFTTFAVLQSCVGVVVLVAASYALLTAQDGTIEPTGVLAAVTVVLVLAALAVQVAFLLALRGVRERPWLQGAPPPVQQPLPG